MIAIVALENLIGSSISCLVDTIIYIHNMEEVNFKLYHSIIEALL